MGAGLAAGMIGQGLLGYMGASEQANAMQQAAQPLPTYYQHIQNPQQQAMWGGLNQEGGLMQNMMGGQMPQMQAQGAPQVANAALPTADWYSNLDPNVQAGIEAPYMRGMEMLEGQMAGRGSLGSARAGMSGAAADVMGQYMSQAGQNMAQTGWGMMQPGLLQQNAAQNQANMMGAQFGQQANMANMQAQMLPYQQVPAMAGMSMGDTLVGNTPTIQEIQPGAAMPPDYQTELNQLQQQQMQQQNPWTGNQYTNSQIPYAHNPYEMGI